MKTLIMAILSGLVLASNVAAKVLSVNNNNAILAFSGEHAGMQFEGRFNQWQSELVLPPSESPKITATFSLASAETGDSTYDETLPEGDWFDVQQFPQASFTSTSIKQVSGGFRVSGELSLKGVSNPVEFMLNSKASGLTASFDIDRLAYGIGVDSDPDAEWVSQFIKMELAIPING